MCFLPCTRASASGGNLSKTSPHPWSGSVEWTDAIWQRWKKSRLRLEKRKVIIYSDVSRIPEKVMFNYKTTAD